MIEIGGYSFDGVLLASSTSRCPGKDRWTDWSLYGSGDGYVVVRIGQSTVPGEVPRISAKTVDLLGLLPALLRQGSRFTVAGRELLTEAARADPRIAALIGA